MKTYNSRQSLVRTCSSFIPSSVLLFVSIILNFGDALSQPRNEDEEFIVHPAWNVGNSLTLVIEGIKNAGLTYSKKTTSNEVKYLHVITQYYEIAYYYNDSDITLGVRIFDEIEKTKNWQEFYNKQVGKWPNLWSRTGEYSFKFEDSNHKIVHINLLRDFNDNVLTVDMN